MNHLDRATFPHLIHLGLLRPRRFFDELVAAMEAVVVAAAGEREGESALLLMAGDEAAIVLFVSGSATVGESVRRGRCCFEPSFVFFWRNNQLLPPTVL